MDERAKGTGHRSAKRVSVVCAGAVALALGLAGCNLGGASHEAGTAAKNNKAVSDAAKSVGGVGGAGAGGYGGSQVFGGD